MEAPKNRILLLDEEDSIRLTIRDFLEVHGFEVIEADTCQTAEELARSAAPDAGILDYRLPDGNALDLLPRLKQIDPAIPLIILTGHGSIELAVRAIKEGAEQFLTKPVELATLLVMLRRLLENRRNHQRRLASQPREAGARIDPFLGTSAAIKRLAEEADRVLATDSTILIEGETGAGKGVLARWLHDHSHRAQEPYVAFNCAGLTRDLLETELFGHEKGAFTGAVSTKTGLLEIAHRGTVFLDEVGDVDPMVQPKLLTVLEEKQFRRVGDVRDRHVDIRLLAATHTDPLTLIQQGNFRADLYFRISAIRLKIPPLRGRREDIPILARHLLEKCAVELRRGKVALSPEAEDALKSYAWPGNIRELRNVMERAVLLSSATLLGPQDLRFDIQPERAPTAGEETFKLHEAERRLIERALRLERGHVNRAAQRLGIPRSSLYHKIKAHGIILEDHESSKV